MAEKNAEKRMQSVQLLVKAAQKVVNARQAGEKVLECVSLQDAMSVNEVVAAATSGMGKALQDVNLYNQVKLLQQIVKTSEDGLSEEIKKPKDELWKKHNAVTKANMVHKRCHPAQVAFEVEEQALFPMWSCPRRRVGGSPALKRLRSSSQQGDRQLKGVVGNVTSSTKLDVSFRDGEATAEADPAAACCLVARVPRVFRAVITLAKPGGCLPVRVTVFADDEGAGKGTGGSQSAPWGASQHELFRRISDQAMLVLHTLEQQSRAEDVLLDTIAGVAGGGGGSGGGGIESIGGGLHLWRSPTLEQMLLWLGRHDDVCTRACSGCSRVLAAHPTSRSLLPPYIRLLPAIRSPAWEKSAYHPQCVPTDSEDIHLQPATPR